MKTLTATLTALLIADRTDSFITRPVEAVDLDLGGIPGDCHHGLTGRAGAREPMYPRGTEIRNRRQLSAVSSEEMATVAGRLGLADLPPAWLGANLLLQGLTRLTKLPAGSRLLFPSGAGLICEGENLPCRQAGGAVQAQLPERPDLARQFVKAAMGLRGIVLTVERPGRLCTGDSIRIITP